MLRSGRLRASALALAALLAVWGPGAAARIPTVSDPAQACLDAADRAGDRHGVPREVMRALARTETGRALKGRGLQPWAWTVNMEGAGRWFDHPAEALAYVEREQARGARSFDIGCFQINHRWHGEAFDSVESMFDPDVTGDYAARFIRDLYDEAGSWPLAAGLYHSRTPEFRDRYRARFARILENGGGDAGPVQVAAADVDAPRDAGPPGIGSDLARGAPPAGWRQADAPPITSGAVALTALRGGLSPMRGAAGPLIR